MLQMNWKVGHRGTKDKATAVLVFVAVWDNNHSNGKGE